MDGRPLHAAQWEATKALVAEFYGLTPAEIGICSCSSEAYNLAALALRLKPGDEVVINDLDFPAGATPWLQEGCPAAAKVWRNRAGALRTDDLVPLLSPKTRLVTVSLVSFFNGFRLRAAGGGRGGPQALAGPAGRGRDPGARPHPARPGRGRPDRQQHAQVDPRPRTAAGWSACRRPGPRDWTVPAGGWFHLEDPFGPARFERAVSKPGAASFTVGMPNYPAVYATRAALDYIRGVGVAAIDRARPAAGARVPGGVEEAAGRTARRRPTRITWPGSWRSGTRRRSESTPTCTPQNIHVMSHAGRLRVAIHGYNTMADVDRLVRSLREALNAV